MCLYNSRLTWKARSVPMKDLTQILAHASKIKRDTQGQIDPKSTTSIMMSEIIRVVEARWVEIDTPSLFRDFYFYYPNFCGEQFATKLDDKAMEMSEQLSGEELALVSRPFRCFYSVLIFLYIFLQISVDWKDLPITRIGLTAWNYHDTCFKLKLEFKQWPK